ncbi:MAG: winged helix-turn-helix domain-containing protein, partial [Kiritimatiellae bacterium]|nr:winged helix-turn-helix domain-containing protein [Kiritimatiellia bacterium]
EEDKQKIRELTEGVRGQKKVVRKGGKKTTRKSGLKSGLNATGELTEKLTEELTEKLTETEQKIVVAIMKDGHITQGKLAKKIGIARTYVTKVMGGLQSRGVIRASVRTRAAIGKPFK